MMPHLRLPHRACFLLALAFLAAELPAQVAARRASDVGAEEAIPLDSSVRAGTLPNGFKYFIRRNTRPEKRLELRLVVNAGSVLEDEDQRGLAHFVEHMLFNGTRRFRKNDIVTYLESIGVRFGADLNAYTGFDETVYILPVPTDKPGLVERGLDILEDWAAGALFDSAEVVNERGVVLEEWRSGLGADSRIRDRQFPVLFQGSRYAQRLPIGDTTVLKTATAGPLRRFYDDWYRPDLMAIVAVGDYDPAQIEAMIRQRFAPLQARGARSRPAVPVPGHDSTLITVVTDPEQPVSSVQVLYKHPPAPLSRVADYRMLLTRRLYNQILNSRLNEIVRQPNAPFIGASSSYGPLVRTADAYFIAAAVEDGGIERGMEAVLREARRVDRHGFLASELDRAKASILRSLESANAQRDQTESGALADELVGYFLTSEPTPGIAWEYETARRVLPAVTLEEVNALGRRWITETNRVIAVSAPEKAGVRVPSAGDLLAAFRRVDAEAVAPYVETVSDAPLVAAPPAAGRITSESRIEQLNVTDWRLSNGVRVLVKPTDFKADEVLVRGWSPGGLSLVSDEDYVSGAFATTAAERGGVAQFDFTELGKKMAGKRASVSMSISSLTEGVSAAGSPRDMETILQLIYLRFTAPRADSIAFNAFRAQVLPFLANRGSDPGEVFSDTITVTMGSNHPRSQPLTMQAFQSARFDRALAIYRDRFADASDFTFVIVGAVNVDSLRPLVAQWLGALPSTNRVEQWRDIGMRAPSGALEKIVRKGVEPKSQTILFFTGAAAFTPQARHELRSLGELLEMRLTERLREALGGTYSVSAGGQSSKFPREEYQFTVAFGSAPERAEELARVVLSVIDSVKQFGATEEEVQRVREQQLRAQEVAVRENGYWLTNLAARVENGEDPRGLLVYPDFIRNLTGAQIRDAARKYLDTARLARFVLLPER